MNNMKILATPGIAETTEMGGQPTTTELHFS